MSYLDLCISLESIVNGNSELLYKIRRNVAILCGKSEADSWTLFKNIDKIYKLRSQIVHGEDYKIELIEKYLPYLINLVSRLIIEIISLNVKEKNTLNDKMTSIGFGDKIKISSEYKYFQFNPEVLLSIEEEL